MSRLFFDTEFYEDGRTIDLISIGIVSEGGPDGGPSLYLENADFDWDRVPADHWIQDNVRPHLRGSDWTLRTRAEARDAVLEYATAYAGPEPEWWAYYADYDWVVLCQLFGRMIDLPPTWPKFCMDIKQLAVTQMGPHVSLTDLVPSPSTEHHALADAQWNYRAWYYLRGSPWTAKWW